MNIEKQTTMENGRCTINVEHFNFQQYNVRNITIAQNIVKVLKYFKIKSVNYYLFLIKRQVMTAVTAAFNQVANVCLHSFAKLPAPTIIVLQIVITEWTKVTGEMNANAS